MPPHRFQWNMCIQDYRLMCLVCATMIGIIGLSLGLAIPLSSSSSTPDKASLPAASDSRPTSHPSKNPTFWPSLGSLPSSLPSSPPSPLPSSSTTFRPSLSSDPSPTIKASSDTFVWDGSFSTLNYSANLALVVKSDWNDSYDRKSIVEFDLSHLSPIGDEDSVILRLYVGSCDTDPNRLITVSRLANAAPEGPIDTDAITWDTLDQTTTKVGNKISVDLEDVGSWLEVAVTDLVLAAPGDDKLVLFLENLSGSSEKSDMAFGSIESGFAPQLIKYDAAAAASAALLSTEDAYIRGGGYGDVRHGLLPTLRVKELSYSTYDRKAIVQFDLGNINILEETTGILQLYVQGMGNVDVFYAAVSRLDDTALDFDEGTTTWNDFELPFFKVKNGNRLRVERSHDLGSWVEVSVSTLLRSLDSSTTNKIALFLESRDASNGEYFIDFESSEGEFAPRLLLDNFAYLPTDEPSPSPSAAPSVTPVPTNDDAVHFDVVADGYIQDGIYTNSNFGTDDGLVVKNDSSTSYDRKAIVEFNLGRYRFGELDSATLRLFVRDMCAGTSRTITVSRLSDDDWQEDTVTWSSLVPTVAKQGPGFAVTTGRANTWIDVDVTTLMTDHASNKVVFFLENLGSSQSEGCVTFASRESAGDLGAQLIRSTLSAVALLEPTADSYVRDGSNKNTNYGLDNILFVKQDSNSDDDRKAILNFDLSGIVFTDTSEAILRLCVSHVEDASSGTITAVRLQDNAWVEDQVTWANLNGVPVVIAVEPVTIEKSDVYSWVQIDVTDLVNSLPASDTTMLMLENRGSSHSSGHVSFDSREGDYAPQLVIL